MRYRWDPVYVASGRRTSPATDTHLRASDAERNEVADKLSRHFAEGRLDSAEFKERLDRAMGATTRGDLSGLFDDLPRLANEAAPPPPSRRRRLDPVPVPAGADRRGGRLDPFLRHIPWPVVGRAVRWSAGDFLFGTGQTSSTIITDGAGGVGPSIIG